MKFKIFIGCIPGSATESILLEVFSKYGNISEIKLRKRRKDKKCAGFGHMICKDKATFNSILKSDDWFIGERKLIVTPFVDKKKSKSQFKGGQEKIDPKKRKILVKNVHSKTTDQEFLNHFKKYGKIEAGFVVRPKDETIEKVHGIIVFQKVDSWKKVIQDSESHVLNGMKLKFKVYIGNSNKMKTVILQKSKQKQRMIHCSERSIQQHDSKKSTAVDFKDVKKESPFSLLAKTIDKAKINHHFKNIRFNIRMLYYW